MDKKRPKKSAGRRGAPAEKTEPTFRREGSWKQRSSSVLWLKLNFTIKAARLQTLKRQKYQHLQEEALLKARGLLKNWEDGPVLLTEDLYSLARTEHEAQELLNYTPEALALRFSLRNHPDVVDAVKQLWSVELPRDEMGCIDQQGYASLFRRIGRSLEPEATKRRRRRMEKTIREDWVRDSKGEPFMSFSNFFDSVFELADLWCESIDVDEYIAFLRRLVLRVSTVRRAKHDPSSNTRRLLRPLKQIKAIDNEEESSSSEELSPSEVDDGEELTSDGSSSDEEEDNVPVQLPPPMTPTHSLGFIATKALQTMRAKTPPPSGSSREVLESNNVPEPVQDDRPWSRERRASIITLGAFGLGGFGGFSGGQGDDKETDPKTAAGLRGASAKSRTTSAKRNPLTSVHERGAGAVKEDDGGVNALVAMHRLRSAQPRAPVVVEDVGPSSTPPNNKVALNVGLPMASLPQQKQQRPAQLITAAFGAPKPGLGVGSVNMDGLPSSGLQSGGALTNSAPHLKPPTGLASGTFGSVDPARVGSGGAHRSLLSSSSSKATQKGGNKHAGIVFEGASQEKGNTHRLAALGAKSSGSPSHPNNPQSSSQALAYRKALLAEGQQELLLQASTTDAQATAHAPREYISGFGLDSPAIGTTDIATSTIRKKSGISSLPFYTFDENASPAKRLLPPVLGERGRSGARSDNTRQAGDRGGHNGPDFSDSYKKTAYLTGSLQAHALAQTGWNVAGSRNGDGRSTPQSEALAWFPVPSKESKSHPGRSTSKQTPKRKLSPDDGYGDVTVSPWDTEFDYDDDLARAFPRTEKHWEPQRTSPKENTSIASESPMPGPQDNPDSTTEPPTLSVSSSMVPPEPPSCVSELTTLPQEYHELVLGGSALNTYKSLGRAESAPLPIQAPVTHKIPSREPQWMLNGASQPSLTLLKDGVEGRTVADTSPRSIFSALTSKRPRRERDVDEEGDLGLCPRFVEHLESHGERAATAQSPLFRTDKPKPRCTCNDSLDGEDNDEHEAQSRCPRHGSSNNNWQEDDEGEEHFQDAVSSQIEDVTVIVNATRGLVLRPGTMDKLAAKRARRKQHATRSEMMRRRCQYTFAKHLG
ncbi:hypothetical protein KRP22_013886 [Phytophthora ramorum]|nr:hypothetical protein KRP22_13714 [Phytophthora ramorum]